MGKRRAISQSSEIIIFFINIKAGHFLDDRLFVFLTLSSGFNTRCLGKLKKPAIQDRLFLIPLHLNNW